MKDQNTPAATTPLVISNALNTPNRLGNDDYFTISRTHKGANLDVGTVEREFYGSDEVLLANLHNALEETQRTRCLIDLIPNELLALIFEFGYFDSEDGQYVDTAFRALMLQTSRRFRQLVLHTPSLWSVVSLSQSNVLEELERLAVYLERSAQYPLDIRLSCFWSEDITDVVMLRLLPYSKRWKRLSIIAMNAYVLSFLKDTPVPILDDLEISFFSHERRTFLPPGVFGGEVPRLTHLCLRNIDLDTLHIPLRGLKFLEIRGYGTWSSLSQFAEMLGDGVSTLENLILHVKPGQVAQQLLAEGNHGPTHIVLPALRTFQMYSSEWLSPAIVVLSRIFVCPHLESFVLREGVGSASDTSRTIASYTRAALRHKDVRLYQHHSCTTDMEEPLFSGFPDRMYVQAASAQLACRLLSAPSTTLTCLELRKPFFPLFALTKAAFAELKSLKHLFFLDTAPNQTMLRLLESHYEDDIEDSQLDAIVGGISIPTLETFGLEIDLRTNREERVLGYKDLTSRFIDIFSLPSLRTLVLKNLEARLWVDIARTLSERAGEYTQLESLKLINMADVIPVDTSCAMYVDAARSFPHLRRLLLDSVGSNAFVHQLLPRAASVLSDGTPGALPWPNLEVLSVYGDCNASKPLLHRVVAAREDAGRPLKTLYLDDHFTKNEDSWKWLGERVELYKAEPGFL